MTVRAASADDGEGLTALMPRLAAFDLPPSRRAEDLWRHDAELLGEWIAGKAPQCRVQVAVEDGGRVVGLAIVSLRPELLSGEPSAHLEAIAVAPGMERRGIGARLLAAAEADAVEAGARTMTLHAFATNRRARGFYEKHGYDGELLRYIKPL